MKELLVCTVLRKSITQFKDTRRGTKRRKNVTINLGKPVVNNVNGHMKAHFNA